MSFSTVEVLLSNYVGMDRVQFKSNTMWTETSSPLKLNLNLYFSLPREMQLINIGMRSDAEIKNDVFSFYIKPI